ncbi:hypothetical protein SAMN05428949_7375 [Chitinophaga sp. YR627]|nr:hypothetical protein SAMN05428949_7375 [Chitinophaga sp. YR627]
MTSLPNLFLEAILIPLEMIYYKKYNSFFIRFKFRNNTIIYHDFDIKVGIMIDILKLFAPKHIYIFITNIKYKCLKEAETD